MSSSSYDVLCLGNAIVDVICRVDDALLATESITKGSMTLIDGARAEALYGVMTDVAVVSGGSAANTAVGVASFGGRSAFIGKVRNDAVGDLFAGDLRRTGVHFATPAAEDGPATARSYIMVTPDGQRSMNTYLGACQNLSVADVDPELVRGSAVTYLEGYLWDPADAKLAFRKAAEIAHAAGRKVAITLSDSFCVDRYRAEFLELIRSRTVDIVFANGAELEALYETTALATAIDAIRRDCGLAVVTVGSDGAHVVTPDSTYHVPACPIADLVDTTGAGDLFAAGYLFGFATGRDHETSARLGAIAAAEVIQHLGAHPQVPLIERIA
ncbi:adenosine kinase [Lichenihabitans sp. Uapishka_5]|uniref:adenosine kinase n=1 Tax=Lichenihabitans sp. Uapishka_5 TaxID=3037302 RepID=UPI0029E80710|nr:adenosine kinase [Lichenihabitans sp. Uapishka_5]MDX7950055.1 adenosine kinase [Lichenihabitans sp. Uapishka_5]